MEALNLYLGFTTADCKGRYPKAPTGPERLHKPRSAAPSPVAEVAHHQLLCHLSFLFLQGCFTELRSDRRQKSPSQAREKGARFLSGCVPCWVNILTAWLRRPPGEEAHAWQAVLHPAPFCPEAAWMTPESWQSSLCLVRQALFRLLSSGGLRLLRSGVGGRGK